MTEREYEIRKACTAAAYGENLPCPEPNEPTEAEALYLQARTSFLAGRQCNGWDAIEAGDTLCGYDLA